MSSSSNEFSMPRRSREEIRVVLWLFLVLLLGVADSQIVSPLLPAIRARVGRSSLEMGHLFTGYSLSAGLSVLIWGPCRTCLAAGEGSWRDWRCSRPARAFPSFPLPTAASWP